MTRHDLKLWHLVQGVLLSSFHVNEASRHVMMLMHQQHINEATAWLSKGVTCKCWCMYHVLTFLTGHVQRNSSCVSKFRGSAACSLIRPAAMVEPDAFAQLLSYVKKETETLKLLRCKTLKDCLLTGKANSKRGGNSERFKHYKMYLALQNKMSAEQKDVLEEWERTNCVQEAVVPQALQQQFYRFIKMLENNRDDLKAMQKSTLLELMCVAERTGKPEYVFGRNVWRRSYEKLDEDRKHSCVLHRFARSTSSWRSLIEEK